MRKVLVSLMSKQTYPNLLLIKENRFKDVDNYIFINTDFTIENKYFDNILNALNFTENDILNIKFEQEDSIVEMYKELNKENLDPNAKYLLNITGGTKLMALGVLNYFTGRMKEVEAFYLAFDSPSFQQIFPFGQENTFQLTYDVSLEEYLKCYGVKELKLHRNFTIAPDKPEDLLPLDKEGVARKWRQTNDKDRLEKYYIENQWFEEYSFQKIKEAHNIPDHQIAFNVKFNHSSSNVENQFDVMFIHDLKLHVVECKIGGLWKNDMFKSAAYKLSAITEDLGLSIQGYLFSKNDNFHSRGQIKDMYKKRADSMNIKLLDENHIAPNKIIDHLKVLIS